jgi:hypothetical protein
VRTLPELLRDAEPFPDRLIEKKPGGASRPSVDYVSWPHYAQRLLLDHGGHEYRVTHVVFGDGKWTVAVAVDLGDESYAGVGTDSSADNAESQAYKRACAHAGIGLHLYGGFWLHGRLSNRLAESSE